MPLSCKRRRSNARKVLTGLMEDSRAQSALLAIDGGPRVRGFVSASRFDRVGHDAAKVI